MGFIIEIHLRFIRALIAFYFGLRVPVLLLQARQTLKLGTAMSRSDGNVEEVSHDSV